MASNPDQPESSQPQDQPDAAAPAPGSAGASESAGATDPLDSRPEQVAEQSLDSAQKAADEIDRQTSDKPASVPAGEAAAVQLPDFEKTDAGSNGHASGLSLLNDIDLHVKVELGRTRMYIEDVLKLNANSIVELDKAAGDPVDIYVNDRHVARGEVLVLSDNFCVRVSEIVKQSEEE